MARSKKEYESKAVTTSIKFTSRISLKVNDTFYTVEACEERMIPDLEGVDIEKERQLLWDKVNSMVDEQADDIKISNGIMMEKKYD